MHQFEASDGVNGFNDSSSFGFTDDAAAASVPLCMAAFATLDHSSLVNEAIRNNQRRRC